MTMYEERAFAGLQFYISYYQPRNVHFFRILLRAIGSVVLATAMVFSTLVRFFSAGMDNSTSAFDAFLFPWIEVSLLTDLGCIKPSLAGSVISFFPFDGARVPRSLSIVPLLNGKVLCFLGRPRLFVSSEGVVSTDGPSWLCSLAELGLCSLDLRRFALRFGSLVASSLEDDSLKAFRLPLDVVAPLCDLSSLSFPFCCTMLVRCCFSGLSGFILGRGGTTAA
jgi:hypothetical protein